MTERGARAGLMALVCLLSIACGPSTPAPSTGPTSAATPALLQSNEPAMTVLPTDPPVDEPAPTATDDGTAGTPPCELFDLKASHGLVEATADTRSTEVVLVAGLTCSIDAFPTFGLVDAKGGSIETGDGGGPGALDLVPGVAYTTEVTVTGWCLADPEFPVNLRLMTATGAVDVTGDAFLDGDLPDCSAGTGPTIEASAWEPAA